MPISFHISEQDFILDLCYGSALRNIICHQKHAAEAQEDGLIF